MNLSTLIMITVITLVLSFIAFLAVLRMRYKKAKKQKELNRSSKTAEDLLELIISVPLSEILCVGDTIEIIVCTNGRHPIASREYVANDWQGKIKLQATKAIKG